jgi:DNA invertase Pin-like site-specific DNA recombinase
MGKIVGYIRVSKDDQDVKNQRLEILEFARQNQKEELHVDEFIEVAVSSRQSTKQRRIDELLEKLLNGSDTLIVTELSRLGRSTVEVISLVNELVDRKIRVRVIKQNLDLLQQEQQDMNSKIIDISFILHLIQMIFGILCAFNNRKDRQVMPNERMLWYCWLIYVSNRFAFKPMFG